MIRMLIIFGVITELSQGQVFRFDYEFSQAGGGWLKYHIVPATWSEARLRCHAEGAVLASPLTAALRSAIISAVTTQRGSAPITIFTGVHAIFSKGDYFSIEGIPLLRLAVNWASGEPDNYSNKESCLAMITDSKGSMSDVSCDEVLSYVCYKKHTELTMTECGTTDKAYKLDARTGSCYKFHSRSVGKGLVWQQAFMTCAAEGGNLVIINSDLEVQVINELFGKHPDNTIGILIGFHDWGERSNFMTIHGETLASAGYNKWGENQPDNSTYERTGDLGEFCGGMFLNLMFNDVACNTPVPFVCEKTRTSLL